MRASERVVVLMSPQEKAALEAKAERAGRISAGELVRRAVDAYDISEDREAAEELRAVLTVFRRTHAETMHELDRVEQKLDRTLADLRAMDRPTDPPAGPPTE